MKTNYDEHKEVFIKANQGWCRRGSLNFQKKFQNGQKASTKKQRNQGGRDNNNKLANNWEDQRAINTRRIN